ncbi:MAG TPA: hypothetical protein VGP70_24080 [Actinomadura sp.]|nr:hypothetical protein [Actinomadura sp.]
MMKRISIRTRETAGLALAIAGAALWAVALTLLTPAARAREDLALARPGQGEILLWAHDLRWAAVVAVVAGLALITCERGKWRSAIPAACGIALCVADTLFAMSGSQGWKSTILAWGLALVLIGFARTWLLRGSGSKEPNKSLAGYGVAAAWCAPLLMMNAHGPADRPLLPTGLGTAMGLTQALLVITAFACVASAGPRVTRPAWLAAFACAGLLGMAGALSAGHPQVFWATFLGGPLVAAAVFLAARPPLPRWYAVLIAATVLYPVVVIGSTRLAQDVLPAVWKDYPPHGTAALPGGIAAGAIVGLAVGLFLGRLAARATPRPAAPRRTGTRKAVSRVLRRKSA